MKSLVYLSLLCTLVACGGGSADAPAPAPAPTPIASAPAPAPAAPAPAPAPAPACVPLSQVTVDIGGDSTNYAIDGSVDLTVVKWWAPEARAAHSPEIELQANMDAMFGPGRVIVSNKAVPGSTAAMWTDQISVANVRLANWAINDKNGGYPQTVFAANFLAWGPTIVQTQFPAVGGDDRELAYVQTVRNMGLPVADAYAYIKSLPNWESYYPNPLSAHVTDELTKMIVDNVQTPLVAQQVAQLLCVKV